MRDLFGGSQSISGTWSKSSALALTPGLFFVSGLAAAALLEDFRRPGFPARLECPGCLGGGLGHYRIGWGSLALVGTQSRLHSLLVGHAVETGSQPFSALRQVVFEASLITQCFAAVIFFGRVLLVALVSVVGFSRYRGCLRRFHLSRRAFLVRAQGRCADESGQPVQSSSENDTYSP